ncbi:MAG: hypothetical protein R3F43_18165 [bacterium]
MRRATWWVWAVLASGAGCDSGDGGGDGGRHAPGRRGGCPPDRSAWTPRPTPPPGTPGRRRTGRWPTAGADADLVDATPPRPSAPMASTTTRTATSTWRTAGAVTPPTTTGSDEIPARRCDDGEDNDGDSLVDLADPDCTGPADHAEMGGNAITLCTNGEDDDGDGLIDFPLDPGCASAGDGGEGGSGAAPQCANEVDDDADGRVDYPNWPRLRRAGDGDEPSVPAAGVRQRAR